jgi:hypothetical protein
MVASPVSTLENGFPNTAAIGCPPVAAGLERGLVARAFGTFTAAFWEVLALLLAAGQKLVM